ncbi:hypothetical protein [Falsiroseomonas selenitidurans]|uniref:Uncharacterized protein n=1 Tax=Falsiroseomonas selenitidurans TaxID=2716335 RepID=A0ABX1E9C2_9PROT|nr:hypothetical protein [Falsiroseomonas selenitidurans]NKC32107.1 hypothetical protein [Falsiroseomonas selenitidurans]
MTETDLPARFLLTASAAQAAALLPALGRVMLGLNRAGATHERIGVVEHARAEDGYLHIGGAAQDARLDLAPVARLVADRSSVMRGKVYPRIEFQAEDGSVLLSVTGMEGAEPFDAELRDWAGTPQDAPPRPAAPTEPNAAPVPQDAGGAALAALCDSGGEVEIRLGTGVAQQGWRGRIEAVKPAMGFANIIRPDFHLHLRDGSVPALRATPEGFVALDAAGEPTGLVLRPLDAAAAAALAGLA